MTKMTRTFSGLAAACLLIASAVAQPASDYPRQPVRMIVTFPPGGSSDAVVRLVLPRLSEKLGQAVIVDNRPGAGGNIGMTAVATASADGYTMGVGAAGALAANVSLNPKMPYDVKKDLRAVSLLAAIPFVLVGNSAMAPRSLPELIALAKAQPGSLSIAYGGNGTAMHLATALLGQMAGVQWVEVPYKGTAPAVVDAMAGQVSLAMADLPAALPHIRSGKLKAFAVTAPQRLPQLPQTPTMAEAGLPGYDATGWFGVVAPAATPKEAIARMNSAISYALKDPSVSETMREMGVVPLSGTPDEFQAYIASETTKWAKVIQQGNIKIQ